MEKEDNRKYYKVLPDNLEEYTIVDENNVLIVTELEHKIHAEVICEELNNLCNDVEYWKSVALREQEFIDTLFNYINYPSTMENIIILLNNQEKRIKELQDKLDEFVNLAADYNIPFEKLYYAFEESFEKDEERKEYIRHLEGKIHRLKKRVQILEKR